MNGNHYSYDFNFPIVRKERKRFFRILKIVFISSATWTFIHAIFFLNAKIENEALRILEISPIAIFLLSTFTLIFYSNLSKNFKLIGDLTITKTFIKITLAKLTREYLLTDVRNIKITYYGSEGDAYGNNPNSMVFKEGTSNYLEFEELNGEMHKYEFYVEKEGRLKQAIMTMESRHIPFTLENRAYK